jgi:hypothetical protein
MKNIKLRVLPSKTTATIVAMFVVVLASIGGAVFQHTQAAAGINKMVSFQGKVVNSNGTNVLDSTYPFRFRIYTSSGADATNTCSANSCMWEETKNIATINGVFQTNLGDTAALPSNVDFNSDTLYLGVVFNGDTEMTPRIRLSAVPYAFNADKLGGLTSGAFVQLSPSSQQTGSINVSSDIRSSGIFQGNALDALAANAITIGASQATQVNIGKTAGGTASTVNGTLKVKPVSGFDSATAFVVQNSGGFGLLTVNTSTGGVGISTDTGSIDYPLSVNGDVGIMGNLHFYNGGDHQIDIASNASGAGYKLTLKGGDAGSGNSNGGNLLLTGGLASGTGARGVVQIDTPVFTTNTNTTCSSNCTISQSLINNGGAVIVNASNPNITITVPTPTNTIAGRIVYVTGAAGSGDFTLEFNSGGNLVDIAMKQNTSATLVWSGSLWSAAGASSSTTLQSAYNNTLASAGGAEIVLNNTATSNGLTIRNASSNPVIGPVFEVQSSIGTELLAVNSMATEYASNGGAETTSTFTSNWTASGAGSVNQYSYLTNAAYVATGQNSVQVNTPATINTGVRNIFSTNLPAGATTYQVSFTGSLPTGAGAFTTLDVEYSPDGGGTLQPCSSYSGNTLSIGTWTKITCTFTSTASATSSLLIIRQTDATARSFYIDNLSVTRNDSTSTPANLQVGGGSFGGNVTLFTLDRSSSPPVAAGNQTLFGSMYYDTTSGRIQCYQANGWGACGSAPDTFVNLSPEYPNAVLGGSGTTGNGTTSSTTPTGVGTMTAEFCSNQANLLVLNSSLCSSGQAFNYYHWTSPQATQQTYSIYVSYQLPGGFKKFQSDSTIQLTGRVDDTTNAAVTYEMFRNQGGTLSRCYDGTNLETPVTTVGGGANTWSTVGINGAEASSCGFSTASANSFVVFKINLKAKSNANAYVGTLSFTVSNQ